MNSGTRAEVREPVGDELIAAILADAEEDEILSAWVGVDLGPVAPNSADAPSVLPSLEDWLRRAEEAYVFLQTSRARGRISE